MWFESSFSPFCCAVYVFMSFTLCVMSRSVCMEMMNLRTPVLNTIITVRNSNCGKVMFSQACVKNSVPGGVHPLLDTPLPLDTPHNPTVTAADGTHPTGIHSCIIFIWWIQGVPGTTPPPPRSNFFHFSTYGQIVDYRLHLWGWRTSVWKTLDPPLIS